MSTQQKHKYNMSVLLKTHPAGYKILYTEHTTSYYRLEKLAKTLSIWL